MVWNSHLFKNFPQFVIIYTVKGFGIVNKAEVDVFLELSCIFDDPVAVGNLISGSPAFSKSCLNIWKFSIYVLLKPRLENFEEELKSLLMKVKEESEKADLKLNNQKTKIMASSPITSWQIDGETMETVRHFILGHSKITADGD